MGPQVRRSRRAPFRPSRRAGAWRVLVAATLVALLGGCQLIAGTAETVSRINQRTGALDVSINLEGERGQTVRVEYGTEQADAEAVRAEADDVAEVVWDDLPVHVERVILEPRGAPAGVEAVTYERAELESRFGARDPDLDEDVRGAVAPVVLGAVVILLVAGLATAVLATILTRRHYGRERSRG